MPHSDYYQSGGWNANCSLCTGKFKANELRKHWTGTYRCERCWEPRQPQDFVRGVPDNQAPPWVQPPNDVYTPVCTALSRSAVPGSAGPGCFVPGFIFLGAVGFDSASGVVVPGSESVWWGNGPGYRPTPDYPPAPDGPPPTPIPYPQLMVFGMSFDPTFHPIRLRSEDDGSTWVEDTLIGVPDTIYPVGIAYRPTTGVMLMVGSLDNIWFKANNSVLYRSLDAGETWVTVANPFPNAIPTSLFFSTNLQLFFLLGLTQVGGGAFLATSTDGLTWTVQTPTTTVAEAPTFIFEGMGEVVVVSGTNTISGTDGAGIFRSVDGASWTHDLFAPSSTHFFANHCNANAAFDPTAGLGRVVAGPRNIRVPLCEYGPAGLPGPWSFWYQSTGYNFGTGKYSVAVSPLNHRYTIGGTPGGAYSDNAIAWSANPDMTNFPFSVIWDHVGDQFIATDGQASAVYKSTDGLAWAEIRGPVSAVWGPILSLDFFPN